MSVLETVESSIREALRTQLWSISEIPGPGARKLENVELDLKALTGQEWVREYTVFDNTEGSLIGSTSPVPLPQRYTLTGSYMVDLFFPKGKSTTRGDVMKGRTLSAFKSGTTLTAGGIVVLVLKSSGSRSQEDQDGWYFRPLMIAWECIVVE